MTSDYLIRSMNPEQCVDFYTRVLGLKLHVPAPHRGAAKQRAHPVSSTGGASEAGASPQDGRDPPAAGDEPHAYFRINHRRIAPYQDNARSRAKVKGLVVTGEQPGELYFMVRIPLQEICARLKELPEEAGGRMLSHSGNIQRLRILKLRDPDGNQLHLVELG